MRHESGYISTPLRGLNTFELTEIFWMQNRSSSIILKKTIT